MPALALVSLLAAFAYIAVGTYALVLHRAGPANRAFAGLCGALAAWAMAWALMTVAPDAETARFWDRVASPFWASVASLALLFAVHLTRPRRPVPRWLWPLLLAPLAADLAWEASDRAFFPILYRRGPWGWVHDLSGSWDWFVAYTGFVVGLISSAAILVVRWGRRSPLARERRQAAVVGLAGLAAFAAGFVTDVLMARGADRVLPVLSHVAALLFVAGGAYAMVRHGLLARVVRVPPALLVDGTSDLMIVVDPEGRVVEANRRTCELAGLAPDELLGKPARTLAADPGRGAGVLEPGPGAARGFGTVDVRSAAGVAVPVEFEATPLSDSDGDPLGVLLVGRDLRLREALRRETAGRSVAERGLASREALVEAALDAISDGVIVADGDGRVRRVNPAAAALAGLEVDEALARPLPEVLHLADEAGGAPPDLGHPGEGRRLFTALLRGRTGARPVEVVVAPLAGPGDDRGYVVAFRDLADQRRAQGELLRASKLECLGVLAGGIAHDFNNMVTAAVGYISMARGTPDDAEEAGRLLERAEEALDRARTLMRQLLAFSRGPGDRRRPVDLAAVVIESARMLSEPGLCDIRVDLASDLRPVPGNPDQLRQVLDNLLLNARQSMPEGGEVRVEAVNVDAGPAEVRRHPRLEPGPCVRLRVSDRGQGIPDDLLSRVFDPFFTTRAEGTGLGLSTVVSVVDGHRGAVDVRSTRGQGTTFEILLPSLPLEGANPA